MNSISVNKFRDNIKSLVEQVVTQHRPLKVTRRSGDDFIVLSADDWEREQLVRKAPPPVCESLQRLINEHDDALDQWLAGAEATSESPTDAYIAFSAMRMCADFM